MIELIELKKTYFQGNKAIPVLKGINLQIEKGEIFGIIGKSGAGKSTLFRCINLLDRPTEGEMIINGHYLLSMNNSQLREVISHIGTVFQNFQLLSSLTASENIQLPLELFKVSKKERQLIAEELLEIVDLRSYGHAYPSELSGGQKQRVAIARALARKPKILLFDEGTSALDPKTTASILELLRKINRDLNITILLITHEMNVIKSLCDRVGLLDHGNLIEQADVYTFFTQPVTSLAKELTQLCISPPLPAGFMKSLLHNQETIDDHPVLKLFFYGKEAEAPLVSYLIKNFSLEINILQGNIEFIKTFPIGVLVITVVGHSETLAAAIKFLQNHNVYVEVIGYVRGNVHVTV